MVARKVSELGKLSAAERQVIAELDTGEDIVLGDGSRPEADSDERRVRAALIRLLLLGDDEDPKYRLHEKGLRIAGAWIPDCLDLEGCRDLRDVVLFDCHFAEVPVLRSAELRNLFLDGSSLLGLSADRLEAGGSVFLHGVEATGEVRLLGSKVGGNLECVGAKFRAEKDAQGNPGDAFSADGLEVGGGVILRGVDATGAVRLLDAKLGGALDCDGAKFRAETDAEGLKGTALTLDGVRVDGAFFLREGAKVDGVLDLSAAQVGDLNDAEASWPEPGLLILDRFQYGAITGGPVDATRRLKWLGRQDPARWGADFWPQPSEQLARVLREMGHSDDARKVLIEKERKRRWTELRRMSWWSAVARGPFHVVFTLMLWMVGYGYRPARALVPALGIVLLGWFMIDRAVAAGALVPPSPAGAVALVPLAYSFEAFVPIVKLGQTDVFRPDMATSAGWWLQVYLWLHGLAGWLIGGIAAAGVLGLFRRE